MLQAWWRAGGPWSEWRREVEASGFQVVQFKWLRFVATIQPEGGEIDGAVVVYL
jgi:hypothetical protein